MVSSRKLTGTLFVDIIYLWGGCKALKLLPGGEGKRRLFMAKSRLKNSGQQKRPVCPAFPIVIIFVLCNNPYIYWMVI